MLKTKIIPSTDEAYEYPLLIKSLLLSGKRYQPDQEIVYGENVRYSYLTLEERIQRLANMLTNAGVKAGDTVAMLDWDSHRYLECFFAVPMLGAILHTVNIRLAPEQIIYTMNHAEDTFVLVHDDFVPLLEKVHSQLTTVKSYIQLSDNKQPISSTLNTVGEYENLLLNANAHYTFEDFNENSVATIFYTTGTTGDPKGVYFTHRQLVLHTLNTATTLSANDGVPLMRSNDVYMPITPMFHVHAWGVPYVATFLGVKQVYPGRYEPEKLLSLYNKEKVTFSHCVPTILQMMLNSEQAKTTDFSGWKLLLGGSALTYDLASQAAQKGALIYSGYGMSETCPILCVTHLSLDDLNKSSDEQIAQRIKTGVPVSMVDLKIIDTNGDSCIHDGEQVGEIVVRSPWLTQGYFKESEKSEELWAGGWLHTGDVASIDKNNTVEIKDRIKDVIKTGGEWVSSLDIENMLCNHEAIESIAVIGIPDDRWGECPLAVVVVIPGKVFSQSIMESHLAPFIESGHINKWGIPKGIRVVEEIPKTSVGKVNKKLLREWLSH